jgi:hypothetical protein
MDAQQFLELQLRWYREDRQRIAEAKASSEVQQAFLRQIDEKIAWAVSRLEEVRKLEQPASG